MEEYNLLTQKLLAEGYTVENHPDYVYIRNSYSETQDPLQNFDGGFRYYEWYIYDQTFRTPAVYSVKVPAVIPACLIWESTGRLKMIWR